MQEWQPTLDRFANRQATVEVKVSELDGRHENSERHPEKGKRRHRPKGCANLVRKGKEVDKVMSDFGSRVDPEWPSATALENDVDEPNGEETHVVLNVCKRAQQPSDALIAQSVKMSQQM